MKRRETTSRNRTTFATKIQILLRNLGEMQLLWTTAKAGNSWENRLTQRMLCMRSHLE
jgi:hypothetical protein